MSANGPRVSQRLSMSRGWSPRSLSHFSISAGARKDFRDAWIRTTTATMSAMAKMRGQNRVIGIAGQRTGIGPNPSWSPVDYERKASLPSEMTGGHATLHGSG
jgi:hypothetical protein